MGGQRGGMPANCWLDRGLNPSRSMFRISLFRLSDAALLKWFPKAQAVPCGHPMDRRHAGNNYVYNPFWQSTHGSYPDFQKMPIGTNRHQQTRLEKLGTCSSTHKGILPQFEYIAD